MKHQLNGSQAVIEFYLHPCLTGLYHKASFYKSHLLWIMLAMTILSCKRKACTFNLGRKVSGNTSIRSPSNTQFISLISNTPWNKNDTFIGTLFQPIICQYLTLLHRKVIKYSWEVMDQRRCKNDNKHTRKLITLHEIKVLDINTT